ncbi:MAG TPA: NAD(+)/NADH kinase [Terriglobales bacterium]
MKKAVIISKPSKADVAKILPSLLTWFGGRGYSIAMDEETAAYGSCENVMPRKCLAEFQPDFALVLGGDGTLLSAARAVSKSGVPILAVNLGSLGFLTEVKLSDMYEALEAVDDGRCPVEDRAVLECSLYRGGQLVGSYCALNDIVMKSSQVRLIHFSLHVNEELAVGYKADGIIIATPTGSTAYSLAAGGPVVMPQVDAIIITPVCPHSFTNRPMVVQDNASIIVEVQSGSDKGVLSIDGQVGEPVGHGDRIECRRAAHNVKLLRTKTTFFDILRTKLNWG